MQTALLPNREELINEGSDDEKQDKVSESLLNNTNLLLKKSKSTKAGARFNSFKIYNNIEKDEA